MNLTAANDPAKPESTIEMIDTQNKLENFSEIELPENPIVVIQPRTGWIPIDLGELWKYRDLILILTARDIKVRYKQTLLGAAWAVIQPLFTMLIFTIFFGRLAGVPSDGIPYPIFAFAGLLPWTFFSNAVTNSGNSLVGNSNLISKVYFPRMIIPISSVASGLVDFAIAFLLQLLLMVWYGAKFGPSLILLPVLVALTSLLAVGIGMWMSALNVKYRDIRYALPFAIQLGLFASPIIYPSSMVPEKWRWVMSINPLAGQIEGYRSAFFGLPIDWTSLSVSALMTFAILVYASVTFKRMERSFADLI